MRPKYIVYEKKNIPNGVLPQSSADSDAPDSSSTPHTASALKIYMYTHRWIEIPSTWPLLAARCNGAAPS